MIGKRYTNKYDIPEEIADVVAADWYTKGESDLSVTGLIKPAKITILERVFGNQKDEHGDPLLKPDVSTMYPAFLGTAVHAMFEKYYKQDELKDARVLTETRMFKTIDVDGKKTTISGQFDLVFALKGLLGDIKVTALYNKSVKKEWEQQLNMYVWLTKNYDRYEGDPIEGLKIDKLAIFILYKDWFLSKKTPFGKKFDIPLWDEETQYNFIMERLRYLKSVSDDAREAGKENLQASLPECTPADRWRNNGRCRDWCLVSSVCEQWKGLQKYE